MLFYLVLLIAILTVIAYYVFKGDFLAPSLICMYMFFISSIAAVIGNTFWKIDVGLSTVLVIILFLLSIFFGDYTGRRISLKRSRPSDHYSISNLPIIEIPIFLIILLLVLEIVSLYFYYLKVYDFSISHGNGYGPSLMLKYYRLGIKAGDSINLGIPLTLSLQFSRFFSYYIFYQLVNNWLYVKNNKHINGIYILYLVVTWAIYALSSSRGGFINYISAYVIILLVSLLKKKNWVFPRVKNKAIIISLFSTILFMLVFSVLGNGTGKTIEAGGALSQIITYSGGSILALDQFLKNPFAFSNGHFESLSGLFGILNRLGFKFDLDTNLAFINLSYDSTTNVYTSIRRYINDFGLLGSVIVGYAIGFFYSVLYKIAKKDNSLFSLSLLIYAALAYPMFYISIDDMFIRGIFSMNTVYMFLYFSIIWIVLVKNRIVVNNK